MLRGQLERYKRGREKKRGEEEEGKGMEIQPGFPFGLLAYQTEGFSIGHFINCCKKILTSARIERLEVMPLEVGEFVEPLAEEEYCTAEMYQAFSDFTHTVTGIKDRQTKKNSQKNDKKKKKK